MDITSDGGYIITGLTGTSDYHTFDIYLVRVAESHIRVDDSVKNSSTPKSLHLSQNYPNPFNPSTTIQYEIPAGSSLVSVKVSIYDIRGRLVRKLVNQEKEPGRYLVHWNGRDDQGRSVSSGVYLYRIEAGEFISTRKMILVK